MNRRRLPPRPRHLWGADVRAVFGRGPLRAIACRDRLAVKRR